MDSEISNEVHENMAELKENLTLGASEQSTMITESEFPQKKRKTRRGKSKRKHPYLKNPRKSNKLVKPEAPHNSNQFLLEDHALAEDLDKNLMSPSTLRTRDSSFSVDSEGDFYSSPDDEQKFLIKDFDDQYEILQAERLQSMSKSELIEEYLALENKMEELLKQQPKSEEEEDSVGSRPDLKQEIERLTLENERLRRENDLLRSKVNIASDSEDSETDSSDSCSSSSTTSSNNSNSSKNSSRSRSPIINNDHSKTNGKQ